MVITLIWLLVILFLSIIPAGGPQIDTPLDKIIHFIVYGITAVVFLRVLRLKVSLTKSIVLSIIFASLYGFAMELLQSALHWREFSFSDELANISGALFFGIIYAVTDYRRKNFPQSPLL
ncbi:MAG: VanZ family protein [Nitrospirota bacterium]